MTAPLSHVQEAIKLTPDGRVELYRFVLRSGDTFYIKCDDMIAWQGNVYEGTAIKVTGFSRSATGQASRPTVTVANPNAVYSPLVAQGLMERATVTQFRVLYSHLLANLPLSQARSWIVNRVASMDDTQISLELRDMTDGPNFLVPARMYIPPEFPMVSLQ